MTDIHDNVALYSSRGWVIHPLSSPNDNKPSAGKRPLLKEWQKLTSTPEDIKKYLDEGCNIGLVCGKTSGVTVIDHDHFTFAEEIYGDFELTTLRSARTAGRGHAYFVYNPNLPAQKHHDLGLEILGDGSNAVLPPSVHKSGDVYRWNNPDTPIIKMPKKLEENLIKLFKTESELKQALGKCRHCFRDVIKRKPNMHGADGRQYMLAVCTDLKARGGGVEHARMFAKLMYGKDCDMGKTEDEWKNIDASKTWTCDKLRGVLPAYVDLEQCAECEIRKQEYDNKKSEQEKTQKTECKEMSLNEILALNKEEQERKLEISLPEDHFISHCLKWLNSINDGYQEYKICSAFWMLSAATRGKVSLRLKQGIIKTNLWMSLLGRSTTTRKSTVVNSSRKVYETATDTILYNDDYSIEGYLETLTETPILNNVRDEVAGLMAKFHKKYNEGIMELECAVYDCQSIKKTLAGGKSSKPRTYTVNDPYVTKLYATTPDNFSRYMTIDDFTCGYGYRFLFSHPKYNREKMPLELEEQEDIAAWAGVLARIKILNKFFLDTSEIVFKVEPEAMKYYNNVLMMLEERADKSNNDFLSAAIGRSQAHILKLAMLIELGRKDMRFVIGMESMGNACKMVVEYFLPEILDVIDRLQEDVKIYQVEKVAITLRRKGGVMTHSKLLHDCKLKSKEFAECIATLVEAKAIESIKENETKIMYYRMLNHNNSEILQNSPYPRILSPPLISQSDIVQKNLENSNKLKELDKTLTWRACRFSSLRESGTSENGEMSENVPLFPESPAPKCFICDNALSDSKTVNFGMGRGDIHESCQKTLDKAVFMLRSRYKEYPQCDSDEMEKRILGMDGYLSDNLPGISGEGIKWAIDVYLRERGR